MYCLYCKQICSNSCRFNWCKIQGYYKRNIHFQRYVVSKPLA